NAIKWSSARGTIRVRCDADGASASVTIADSGPGIPRDEQRRIFERFYRVHTGLLHDVKGSGIGLAIVKHIVDAHRGEIELVSDPGKGSAFTLRFPAAAPEPHDSRAPSVDGPSRGRGANDDETAY